jgi:murein DD-endopeptidase MepM/ murein hydrolase activator NlpD
MTSVPLDPIVPLGGDKPPSLRYGRFPLDALADLRVPLDPVVPLGGDKPSGVANSVCGVLRYARRSTEAVPRRHRDTRQPTGAHPNIMGEAARFLDPVVPRREHESPTFGTSFTARSLRRACFAVAFLLSLDITANAQEILFRFPGSDQHRQFFNITAYRDNSGDGNGLQDWNCGTDTYDGHRGTDMGVGGFAGMDAGRDIVASADGTVVLTNDGVDDRCTTGNCAGGSGFGNFVKLQHADGSFTTYAHMKKFTVAVAVGDVVSCGEKLGQVGSSGFSTGPHLHFEPRNPSNVSYEPFGGSCGAGSSAWVEQGAYQSLPQVTCESSTPPIPPHPLLVLDTLIDPIDGQPEDTQTGASSAGIFDLEDGQTTTVNFFVTNELSPNPQFSPDVVFAFEALGGFVEVVHWEVFDNFPTNACGGQFCPNDANDNALNPPHDFPGEDFSIHLNAFGQNETKKLVLQIRNVAPTNGEAPHAVLRGWVQHVEGFYDKPTFDSNPTNINDLQTFNGGDLKVATAVDTWAAVTPPDPDPGEGSNGGKISGGCAVGDQNESSWWLLLGFAFVLRGKPRIRRRPLTGA